MSHFRLFFLFASSLLALQFASPGRSGRAAAPGDGQSWSVLDTSCVDTVTLRYGLLRTDTCSLDSAGTCPDTLCCVFRFQAVPNPYGTTGLSYSWTLQELPGGAVQSIGTGQSVDVPLPPTCGSDKTYNICVTVSKPGCPTKKYCRKLKYNSNHCAMMWLQ